MKINWNFLGEVGAKQKACHGGSMDIFSGTALFCFKYFCYFGY